jgi:3-isopropylmalate dehydratase small subunit
VVAASAVKGMIVTPADMDADIKPRDAEEAGAKKAGAAKAAGKAAPKAAPGDVALQIKGRVWLIDRDNIDTDMIFHNKHLAVTEIEEMGRYCFGNLEGWTDFAEKARPNDIVVTGGNFGCGSSRQHAVDCFKSLGVTAIVAKSFGAIYERNAINAGLPILEGDLGALNLKGGETISIDLMEGEVSVEGSNATAKVKPFSEVQLDIYKRGGLLNK